MSLTRLYRRDNLNARGAISNDCNNLICIIEIFRPICTVHELALKVLETRDVWPLPVATETCQLQAPADEQCNGGLLEHTGGIEQEVGMVIENVSRLEVLDFQFPYPLLF
jgi:hypothetical protein